jgi:hypothetical protein
MSTEGFRDLDDEGKKARLDNLLRESSRHKEHCALNMSLFCLEVASLREQFIAGSIF